MRAPSTWDWESRKIVQTRTFARYTGESAEPLLSDIKKTDDHASLGDEDTEQNRPKAGALQAYELWMATFAHWEGTKSRLKPGVLAVLPWERGVRHGC